MTGGGPILLDDWEVSLDRGLPEFFFAPFFVPMSEVWVMGGLSVKERVKIRTKKSRKYMCKEPGKKLLTPEDFGGTSVLDGAAGEGKVLRTSGPKIMSTTG